MPIMLLQLRFVFKVWNVFLNMLVSRIPLEILCFLVGLFQSPKRQDKTYLAISMNLKFIAQFEQRSLSGSVEILLELTYETRSKFYLRDNLLIKYDFCTYSILL